MSLKRCCVKILDMNEQQILSKIYEFVVRPLLQDVVNLKVPLNGETLTSVVQIDAAVIEIVASLNAKITIYYFMKLLQSEFERLPNSNTIRGLIAELYQNKSFQALSVGSNPEEEFGTLFGLVKHVNENYLRDALTRPHLNKARFQMIARIPGFEERF